MKKPIALPLVFMMLSGCTITQTVDPIEHADVALVCVVHNEAVLMDGFEPALVSQINELGIETRVYDARPEACPYVLEYTANWSWDLAMYVTYIELSVFHGGREVGEAVYDARSGGANLFGKFGPTEHKLQPLVDELFGAVGAAVAVAGQ